LSIIDLVEPSAYLKLNVLLDPVVIPV